MKPGSMGMVVGGGEWSLTHLTLPLFPLHLLNPARNGFEGVSFVVENCTCIICSFFLFYCSQEKKIDVTFKAALVFNIKRLLEFRQPFSSLSVVLYVEAYCFHVECYPFMT